MVGSPLSFPNPCALLSILPEERGRVNMDKALLGPGLALVLWTGVMWAWVLKSRLPLLRALRAGRVPSASAAFPPEVARVSNNYNHLHEQPTVFYAVLAFATLGELGSPLAVGAAWAYVAFRIGHSLEQARHDRIPRRFLWFLLASLAHFVLLAAVLGQLWLGGRS